MHECTVGPGPQPNAVVVCLVLTISPAIPTGHRIAPEAVLPVLTTMGWLAAGRWSRPGSGTGTHPLARAPGRLASGLIVAGLAVLCVAGARRLLATAERRAGRWQRLTQLMLVLEESPMGFAVYDPDLRYTYVNRAMARFYGMPPEAIIGRTPADVFPHVDVGPVNAALLEVLRTGMAQLNVEQTVKCYGRSRQMIVSRYPLRDRRHRVIAVATTFFDITDRWRIAQLEEETERLRTTAALVYQYEAAQRIAALGTWETDFDRHFQWSKQTYKILGFDAPVNDASAFIAESVHPDDRDLATACYQRLVERGKPFRVDIRMIRQDGTPINTITTGEPVRDDSGAIVRYWGTIQDVTDHLTLRAERAEALRDAQLARAEQAAEHAALQIVQRAMLPTTVPEVPGVELAVTYRPVAGFVDIGGDWYDAFTLPDGGLVVTVGDVAGHDLHAATVMGQVRNALRAYAIEHARPGEVLHRINAMLMALPDPPLATVVYGVLDPTTFRFTFARAGHQPPLLRHRGRCRELADPSGIALGAIRLDRPYAQVNLDLEPGDLLLLYTDGLVERRGHDTGEAVARLHSLVEAVPAGVAAAKVSEAVIGALTGLGTVEDDICLLVLHRPVEGFGED